MLPERYADLLQRTAGIQGWLHAEAGRRLHDLALLAPDPNVIELGSWRGLSTAWLATGIEARGAGHVYAVDTWLGTPSEDIHKQLIEQIGGSDNLYLEFRANLHQAGVADHVTGIRATTVDALRDVRIPLACGVLFIDADHEREAVLGDYRAWSRRVVKGGYVVFDDVPSWPGPTSVAREVAASELEFVVEEHNHWIGRKR